MEGSKDIEKALLSCYNASYGGRYELAGRIENLGALDQLGFVSFAECRKDPLSDHGALSCRVILIRMTKKGISEAQKIVKEKVKQTGHFLESLDSLPPRVKELYRLLLKRWLGACEHRSEFDWTVRNLNANSFRIFLPIPEEIKESISRLNAKLVENGLAAYAALHHNTKGPSIPTLVTCPEIKEYLLNGPGLLYEGLAIGVKTTKLDEYLSYLLDGLSQIYARNHLLFLFHANRYEISDSLLRWVSMEYGISIDSLLSWLEELEGCGYISKFNKEAMTLHPGLPSEEYIVARGDPWMRFLNPDGDLHRIADEIKRSIEKWFQTGEEKFHRFEFRPAW